MVQYHAGKGDGMLSAVEYIGPIGFGATSPQLFRCEDGKLYVVKLNNNKMGTKVLVNEYLAYWYAGQMELCFPPGGLVTLSPELLEKNRRFNEGPHFASLYLSNCRYVVRQDFPKAMNKKAMAGVILFDHMFHNLDRTKNRRNLLLRREGQGYMLYAIDNSHLFVRGRWDKGSLEMLADRLFINRKRAFGWLLKYFLRAADFYRYVGKVKGMNDSCLCRFVEQIPESWLPEEKEREALFSFMQVRRDRIEDIFWRICRSIPDIHGSTDTDQRK